MTGQCQLGLLLLGVIIGCIFGPAQADEKKDEKKENNVVARTVNGTKVGSMEACTFPFYYKNKKYTKCTLDDSLRKDYSWCAVEKSFTDEDLNENSLKWGYCQYVDYNDGPNPRDYATCSLNTVDKRIQTVTFDDAFMEIGSKDSCELLLVETNRLFGKDGRYTGFKVTARTDFEKNGFTYIRRVDTEIYDNKTKAKIEVSFRNVPNGGQVLVDKAEVKLDALKNDQTKYKLNDHELFNLVYTDDHHLNTAKLFSNEFMVTMRLIGAKSALHVNILFFNNNFKEQTTGVCGNTNGNEYDDYCPKKYECNVIEDKKCKNCKELNKNEVVNTFFIEDSCIEKLE